MAKPIVLQLQELAADGTTDPAELLRKAMLVATKLKLEEFRSWTMFELDGYKAGEQVPDYRIIKGDLRVENPINGLIPLHVDNPDYLAQLRKRGIYDSIEAIMRTATSRSNEPVGYTFSPATEARLMREQTSIPMRPVIIFSRSQFAAIVSAVRTKVLRWALALEEEGILGDGLSFSDKERDIAHAQNIRIDNFQGILGNVNQGGQVRQNNTLMISAGDFVSLSTHLQEQGVSSSDIAELKSALGSDEKPKGKQTFGPRVSGWIGRMVAKAADGTWEVSVATAGTMLATALAKYYGLM